ncbi:hypothetical protein U1Q18_042275 [Sarracenia purpurea var. burkii]
MGMLLFCLVRTEHCLKLGVILGGLLKILASICPTIVRLNTDPMISTAIPSLDGYCSYRLIVGSGGRFLFGYPAVFWFFRFFGVFVGLFFGLFAAVLGVFFVLLCPSLFSGFGFYGVA